MPDFQSRQTVSSTAFKKSLRSLSFCIVSRNRALTQVLQLTRQAHQPGCEPAQIPALAQIHRRRARRPPVRQPPRPQLVLDQPGLDVQVLRGHPCRPPAQGHPPRSAYQLDHKARPQGTLRVPRSLPLPRFPHIVICPGSQSGLLTFVSTTAPRIPRPHRHRQEVARSRQGPQLQQDDGRPPQDVEAAQHPLALALPLSGALSDGSCGGVWWWVCVWKNCWRGSGTLVVAAIWFCSLMWAYEPVAWISISNEKLMFERHL